ncbi:MAG: DUF2164 domain-containing protein [Defluviitaleaceae bacterium]|nr:DUF2164 domain-containing protein [Defluviitaleaceae bacterium]
MRQKKEEIILLTKEQKTTAAVKIRDYIAENFDIEIGNMQSEFFLEYITNNIGVYYYNKAVADSLAFISDKTEDMYLLMKDEG